MFRIHLIALSHLLIRMETKRKRGKEIELLAVEVKKNMRQNHRQTTKLKNVKPLQN